MAKEFGQRNCLGSARTSNAMDFGAIIAIWTLSNDKAAAELHPMRNVIC